MRNLNVIIKRVVYLYEHVRVMPLFRSFYIRKRMSRKCEEKGNRERRERL